MNSPTPQGPWSTGLFDCFDDLQNCFITWFCPSITFGRIAGIVDKGEISSCKSGVIYSLLEWVPVAHCAPLYSFRYRSKLRQQYSLKEAPYDDCIVHFFCEHCALCQEYRQLKHHGFDMSIGWQGNVEKQQVEEEQQVELAKAPVVEEGMAR